MTTAFAGHAWGDEASFAPSDFSGQGTSGTGSAISATVDGVTFACDKGYGTTQIRCYSGSKITISSSNTITAISFTFSGSYTGGLETSYTGLSTQSWEKTLSSQARITAVTVTYSNGSVTPILEESDLSLTNAPVNLSFDLYNNSDAQVINYTTSSTGAVTVSSSEYVTTVVNETAKTITVTPVAVTPSAQTITVSQAATDTYAAGSVNFTVSISNSEPVLDYITLPFEWEGGTSSGLTALEGVTANGLGSDYAAGNAPYRVKFDTTGDYIQFKTNERPGIVTIGVKMLGGANTSSFTVQESADGEEFTDLQSLSIRGRQNDVLTLETTQAFAEATRYVRLYFTKGSNVGVGPISIAQYADFVLENYTLTIANPDNVTISAAYGVDGILVNGDSEEITQGTEITLTVNPAEGYDFESVTITGEEGQSLTPTPTPTDGVYTFAMPAYNATVSATVVEHVDPVFSCYTLAESITSGKHYVITSGIEGDVMVMGNQGSNNRSAVGATTISDDGVLTISDEYEVLIEGNVNDGFVILDDKGGDQGCLYAASSSNNYLRTQSTNNKNGLWYIQIIDEETPPVIYATGINTRNYLRFNSSNNLFSCYGLNEDNQPGQAPIYLFERTEEDIPQTVTITLNRNLRTYAGRYDLDFTNVEGLKAYYPTELGEDYKLTMVEPTSPVMAGCGLMLSGTAGVSYEVPVALNFGNLIERNLLVGLLERTTVSKTQDDQTTLILSAAGSNGLNWYAMSKDGELKANSAYLLLPTADLPEDGDGTRLTMDFCGGSNGISVASVKQNTNTWFTIDGRQLKAKPVSKGIYVNNGKKVVIK